MTSFFGTEQRQVDGYRSRWLASTSPLTVMLALGSTTACIMAASGAAGSEIWTGATSTDWFTASNWSPASVPGGGDQVNIDTKSPNQATIAAGNAFATVVFVGLADGSSAGLSISNNSTLSSVGGGLAFGLGSTAAITVSGAGSAWTNSANLLIGGTGTATLDVLGGGAVSNFVGILGSSGGALGTVTVDGAGSTWTNNSTLIVGQSGYGNLYVSAGGNVISSGAIFGDSTGSNGYGQVNGSGSNLTNTGSLVVGNYGTSTLDVQNGGTVDTTSGTIGNNAGGLGIVNVDGAGSNWTNTGDLSVGFGGTGTLNVLNGGAVSNVEGYLGQQAGSSGTATVDGAGSKWTISHNLEVGRSGMGTLTVRNGGTVSSVNGNLGELATGTGYASVDGAGSSWDNTSLEVGNYGTGTLEVTNGGHVTVSTWSSLGSYAGSSGTMTVDGVGSSYVGLDWLDVGEYGTGTLFVKNGGSVSDIDGYVGDLIGSSGTATVDGAGSTWTNSGDMYVGNYDTSTGTLRVLNGGAVTSAIGYVAYQAGSAGTLTIDGTGSTWTSSASTYIGVDGAGTLAITNGGSVSGLSIVAGYAAGSTGTMTVDGAGSNLNATSDIVLGVLGSGSLTLSNGGGASTVGDILLANQAGATGAFNIGAAVGSAAQAAGAVTANAVSFGPGIGSLNFNHTDAAYNFATPITGLGTINQLAGVTKLTGNSSGFTGTTYVAGGGLYVNGSLSGTIDVTGGLLGGSGMLLGTVTIGSGGTIAPGNSIGTLNVADATLAAGSVYAVELESGGTSDLINATGTVAINGGNVTAIAYPDYALGTTYTIVTAAGGVSGVFDSSSFAGTAFIKPILTYDANNVYLDLVQLTVADLASTPNQQAAAAGADSLGAGNSLYDAIYALGTPEEVQLAADAISGEVHASAKTALIEDSRFVREVALERLRFGLGDAGAGSNGAGETGLWLQSFGAYGRAESDGNAAAMTHATGGLFIGTESAAIDDWQFGVLAGVSKTGFSVDGRASSGTATSYHAGAYGGTVWGDLAFRFGGAYSWQSLDISRMSTFTGFGDSLASTYGAGTGQAFGELGYGIDAGLARFEPFINLAYVDHRTAGFTESGGVAALSGTADMISTTFATLGMRAEGEIALGEAVAAHVNGMVGWRHAFGDTVPNETLAFAGGSTFTVAGAPVASDALMLELGLDLDLSPTANLAFAYSGQIGSSVGDHSVKANLGLRF